MICFFTLKNCSWKTFQNWLKKAFEIFFFFFVKMLLPELNNKFGPVISGRLYFRRVQEKFDRMRTKHQPPSSSSLNSANPTPHAASDHMVVNHLLQEKKFWESACPQEKPRGEWVLWEMYVLLSFKGVWALTEEELSRVSCHGLFGQTAIYKHRQRFRQLANQT